MALIDSKTAALWHEPHVSNGITREDLIEALSDIVKEFDRKRLIVSPDLVEPDVEDAMQPVREARTLLLQLGKWQP